MPEGRTSARVPRAGRDFWLPQGLACYMDRAAEKSSRASPVIRVLVETPFISQ